MTRSFKAVFILLTTFLTFLSSVSCKKEPAGVTGIYFTNIQKGSVSMNEGEGGDMMWFLVILGVIILIYFLSPKKKGNGGGTSGGTTSGGSPVVPPVSRGFGGFSSGGGRSFGGGSFGGAGAGGKW